jgi:hypothetical protein
LARGGKLLAPPLGIQAQPTFRYDCGGGNAVASMNFFTSHRTHNKNPARTLLAVRRLAVRREMDKVELICL